MKHKEGQVEKFLRQELPHSLTDAGEWRKLLAVFAEENHVLGQQDIFDRIKKVVKELRPYPFRPCPKCGGKLKLGSSKEMRYGCYNEKCPSVKENNYFHVDMYDRLAEAESLNQGLNDILLSLDNQKEVS